MTKIDLNTVSSGYLSQSALNDNFTAIENEFQNKVLYRNNPSGEPNSMQTNLDMNGYSILNAGNISSTTVTNADDITYTLDGIGAEARTVSAKLNEVVSFKDFGAVGDGVTDDTAAIEAAIAHAVSLNDNITGEGVKVILNGQGTFAISRTIDLEGEGIIYRDLSFLAIDGEWDDTPLIVLASGQSNMRGTPTATGGTWKSNSKVYAWLATSSSSAGSWIQNPNFQTTTYYVPQSTTSLGGGVNNIALAFCYRLQEASNRPVRLVIECQGNQNITQWVGSGTSSARYAAMKSRLEEALAAASLSSLKVDVFLWQQGENNSADSANTYEDYLDTLFSQLSTETWWNTSSTASILGELHDDNASYSSVTTGIHQRWSANKGLTMFADSVGLTDVGDLIHYDGPSLFEMGYRRYFDALLRTTKSWCSPMLSITDPGIQLQNVLVFANRKAAGIDVASGGAWIDSCEVSKALDYGIRLKGTSGDTRVISCLVTGLRNGDTEFTTQDYWNARGVWNGRADNKMTNTIVRWCSMNVFHDYNAATFLISGCHFYAGGSGALITNNPVNVEIRSSGVSMVGCYLDNGRINIHNGNVLIKSSIILCNTSAVTLDQVIGVFANGNTTPFRVYISDVVPVSGVLLDGTVPVIKYLPYASFTWSPNFSNLNSTAPYEIETVGTKVEHSWEVNEAVHRFQSGNSSANGAKITFRDADTVTDPAIRSSGNDIVAVGDEVRLQTNAGWLITINATGGVLPKATDDMTLGSSGNQWASGYINNIVQAAAATGGTGSGGAGNQYVALRINGVTYKLLHDGTL